MTMRIGTSGSWRVLDGMRDIGREIMKYLPGESALQAWMLWAFRHLRGKLSCSDFATPLITLLKTLRTGVRAAVDWLFIRVQNSRRFVVASSFRMMRIHLLYSIERHRKILLQPRYMCLILLARHFRYYHHHKCSRY